MFEKIKLNKQIKKLQKQIYNVEQKRVRSQGALVEAILTNTTPNDVDVDFFNKYTEEITILRNDMHELQAKLKTL